MLPGALSPNQNLMLDERQKCLKFGRYREGSHPLPKLRPLPCHPTPSPQLTPLPIILHRAAKRQSSPALPAFPTHLNIQLTSCQTLIQFMLCVGQTSHVGSPESAWIKAPPSLDHGWLTNTSNGPHNRVARNWATRSARRQMGQAITLLVLINA